MDALPQWEQGTPAILIAAGPHAIPVSTALRRGDRRVVLALGRRRDVLERLRADPGAALAVLTAGAAFTAYGTARVVREELDCAPVAAVELAVDRVQDHLADGRTEMLGAATYRWLDGDAAAAEPQIWAELAGL
jgi:hypothetical protein